MQETFIKGYQWSPVDGHFVGDYEFPNNLDKEEVHLPPFTTLTPPPCDVPCGCCVFWRNGAWVIEADPTPKPERPPIDDYTMLMPWYIEHLKKEGQWSEEDQQNLDEALAEKARREAEAQLLAAQYESATDGGEVANES